jgi:hypothetical protein
MLKVGVSDAVDHDLHRLLPDGISLELIPLRPTAPVEIEFWITPPWTSHAEQQLPFLRGMRVAASTTSPPRSGPSLPFSLRSNISLCTTICRKAPSGRGAKKPRLTITRCILR